MSKVLNKTVATVVPDKLIYDSKYPIDGKVARIVLSEEGASASGVLKRGQLLDIGSDGYSVHEAEGAVDAVLAEDVSYGAGATDVYGSVYISGTFLRSACVTDVELTNADLETLRGKGIYLK